MSVQRKPERYQNKDIVITEFISPCRGRDEHEKEHRQELEVPIICARKVETTPVPDLDIYDDGDDVEKGRKGVNRLDGDAVRNTD